MPARLAPAPTDHWRLSDPSFGETVFTNVAAPVMTRLRQPDRQVLDVLIAGGVARSRSEALAWCVRQVHANAGDWLSELRDSLEHVRQVRDRGPDAAGPSTNAGT